MKNKFGPGGKRRSSMSLTRREFVVGAAGALGVAGCEGLSEMATDHYSAVILGDTHFDAEPESVYHSHYDESNKWAKVQHAEFLRNGEMWRGRCRELLAASAKLAHERPTRMILQMGDIIQGDCDDVPTHKRMLDDCIRMLRTPYPAGIPFLTVMGNHDIRGKGAKDAYFQFAEAFLEKELGQPVKYPAFSFRRGRDLWVFCNFEETDLSHIIRVIEADPDARHVFLVTHGPFTTADGGGSWRWRLGGRHRSEELRPKLYELLSRRHAIVLSGHTHTVAYYRHENAFGGFCEFTANSVWAKPELATADSIASGADEYGKLNLARLKGKELADYKAEMGFFRRGLKDYFMNQGAGHFRLNVGESDVTVEFYPGASIVPARTFVLKGFGR